jgi:hypothetical protein
LLPLMDGAEWFEKTSLLQLETLIKTGRALGVPKAEIAPIDKACKVRMMGMMMMVMMMMMIFFSSSSS